jgi:uncharacterized coiled-coil DUF342 family protein
VSKELKNFEKKLDLDNKFEKANEQVKEVKSEMQEVKTTIETMSNSMQAI